MAENKYASVYIPSLRASFDFTKNNALASVIESIDFDDMAVANDIEKYALWTVAACEAALTDAGNIIKPSDAMHIWAQLVGISGEFRDNIKICQKRLERLDSVYFTFLNAFTYGLPRVRASRDVINTGLISLLRLRGLRG